MKWQVEPGLHSEDFHLHSASISHFAERGCVRSTSRSA